MGHTEGLLLGVYIGLYLYDSASLLYANEVMLIPLWKGSWIAGFGSKRTTIKGRELFIPNPFFPSRPQFRVAWRYRPSMYDRSQSWEEFQNHLHAFVPFVLALFISSFVLLPIALFGMGGDQIILMTFSLIYINVILIVSLMWSKREEIGMKNNEFISTAFDFFICPPFALNVVRRLSGRTIVNEDLVSAASRLQSRSDWDITRAELISRIDEELEGEDKDSELFTSMQAKRNEIALEEENDKT